MGRTLSTCPRRTSVCTLECQSQFYAYRVQRCEQLGSRDEVDVRSAQLSCSAGLVTNPIHCGGVLLFVVIRRPCHLLKDRKGNEFCPRLALNLIPRNGEILLS